MGQKEKGKANGLNDTELYGGTGMKKIIRNAIRCKFCGDVIESETVLEFKSALVCPPTLSQHIALYEP